MSSHNKSNQTNANRSKGKNLLIGCLLTFVVLSLVCVVFAIGAFAYLRQSNPQLLESLESLAMGVQGNEQLQDIIESFVLGAVPEERIEFTHEEVSAIAMLVTESSESQVVILDAPMATETQLPTRVPTQISTVAAQPVVTLTDQSTIVPSATPTEEPTATATQVPTSTQIPTEAPRAPERTFNAYDYLRSSLLLATQNFTETVNGLSVDNASELLGLAHAFEAKLNAGEPLVFNIIITDRADYSGGMYSYYTVGQEHIGNSDGIIQVVVSEMGTFAFFFGRDHYGPRLLEDGSFWDYAALFRMGSLRTLSDGATRWNPDGSIQTWSDYPEDLFEALSGNTGDLSIKMSLGRLNDAFGLIFPDGVDLTIPNGIETPYVQIIPGATVHFTGPELIHLLRQRMDASRGYSSYTRGSLMIREILSVPENITNLTDAADLSTFLVNIFGEDFTDESRTLTIQPDADDRFVYQLFSSILYSNPRFASDFIGTLANSALGGNIHIVHMPPVEGSAENAVNSFRSLIAQYLGTEFTPWTTSP